VQAYITAVWACYSHIKEWRERGREGGGREGGKREGEQEGEERKCKEANLVKVK